MSNVLTCITKNENAEAVINYAKKFTNGEENSFFVLLIISYESYYASNEKIENDEKKVKDTSALENIKKAAYENDADFKLIYTNNIQKSVDEYIKFKKIDTLVFEDKGEFRALGSLKNKVKIEVASL